MWESCLYGSVRGRKTTVVWKRYCGTAAKAGGNRENKHLPTALGGSCLLEKTSRQANTKESLGTKVELQEGEDIPFGPRRRSTIIAVPGAGVRCGSMRPSLISSLASLNSRGEKSKCLLSVVLTVTERLWNIPGSKARPKDANSIV